MPENINNLPDLLPLEQGLFIKGNLINPPEINQGFLRRKLGKFAMVGSRIISEQKQQRSTFINNAVDAMGNGGFDSVAVGNYELVLSEDDYADFGYLPIDGRDSEYNSTFFKENDETLPSLTDKDGRDWYRIIETSNGEHLFLKTANKTAKPKQGLLEARQLVDHLPEVFASRLAKHIEYPVPEAWPVLFDGKPWLASAYIKDHIFKMHDELEGDSPAIGNQMAIASRRIFNMLAGSSADCSNQSVIDPAENKYYAQDVTMMLFDDELNLTKAELTDKYRRSIAQSRNYPTEKLMLFFDRSEKIPEEYQDYVRGMLTKVQNLTSEQASEMFAFGRGEFQNSEDMRTIMKNRADSIVDLLDLGEI